MKFLKLGITTKLLLTIIPLVVAPVLITGIVAYSVAEGSVTTLLNQAQINLARQAAERVSGAMRTAKTDLGIISSLPALSGYYYNKFYQLHSEAEINRKQVEKFFLELSRKSRLYYRICFVDRQGRKVVEITQAGPSGSRDALTPPMPLNLLDRKPGQPYISPTIITVNNSHRVMRLAQPIYNVWNNLSGFVLLELDFDELSRRILSLRVGRQGYPFVVDEKSVVRIHPQEQYLDKASDKLDLPSVEELIATMMDQGQGMASYFFGGKKVAAFTRVPDNGWVVAVTLPVGEFTEGVEVIKDRVFLIVVLSASFALGAGVFFSLFFVRPIRKLALATQVVSQGRLPRQIEPVANDELGSLTRSFNQMVRDLRSIQDELLKSEKLVSLGRLATGVAHEIRNPLNAMKVSAEVLRRKKKLGEGTEELLKVIYSEISHLEKFVTDFLSYSRQPPPRYTQVSVNQLLNDILDIPLGKAGNRQVRLDKRFAPGLPTIPMDPFQIERALLNVVTNSIEAMPNGGRLTVSTALASGAPEKGGEQEVRIEFLDTGVGIDAETLRNVFDPFFTTKDYGTGLGLALSEAIISAHGGSIRIESTPGEGSKVIITLPLRQDKANSEEAQ